MISANDLDVVNLDLFPVRVYKFNISNLYPIELETIKNFLIEESSKDEGVRYSNVGGWQSSPDIAKSIHVRNFIRILDDIVFNVIIKSIHMFSNDTVRRNIVNVWGNVNNYGDFNAPHVHPDCWYSGCVYLQVDDDTGGIEFIDTSNRILGALIPDSEDTYEKNNYHIKPEFGDVLLFPSGLLHYTFPNKSEKSRISLAFNIK